MPVNLERFFPSRPGVSPTTFRLTRPCELVSELKNARACCRRTQEQRMLPPAQPIFVLVAAGDFFVGLRLVGFAAGEPTNRNRNKILLRRRQRPLLLRSTTAKAHALFRSGTKLIRQRRTMRCWTAVGQPWKSAPPGRIGGGHP